MMQSLLPPRTFKLAELLAGLVPDEVLGSLRGQPPVLVSGLTLDSRAVVPGTLFCALRGHAQHGLRFAAEAIAAGASAILWEPGDAVDAPAFTGAQSLPCLAVPALRERLGLIADRYFGSPSAAVRVTAFTGTNGKTSCAWFLASALGHLGIPAAYIGTLGWGRVGALQPLDQTTPDAVSLHRILATLRADGITEVALEVSSHALDQHRIAGVRVRTAAFTNLTHDHLDYHGTMEAYGAAKARLFAIPGLEDIILNVGDPFGAAQATRLGDDPRLTALWLDGADPVAAGAGPGQTVTAVRRLRAAVVNCTARGLDLGFDGTYGPVRVTATLIGRFNAENLGVVLACLLSRGFAREAVATALGACQAPPGRMELITAADRPAPVAVVDYAHTPDALAKALQALRVHCAGALWCLFGCGGDRDAAKRPLMGAVADRYADQIIVTDDNPRSESPELIAAAIVAGVRHHTPRIIPDRARAIATALTEAAAADIVLIAGKGHEDYQVYGATRRPFSDRAEARRHLREAA